MRMNNYKIKIKTVFIALLIFLMGCAILGYSFINDKSANALSDVPEIGRASGRERVSAVV